ncbi:MAG: hypothetical protein AAF702_03095 [Chloroflexota bacterium]
MKRSQQLVLCLILLLAFWLRMVQLDGSSLWSDEGNTWALVQRSNQQIALDAAADIHPPGYYWVLKGWTTWVGHSAAGMRLFSVFAGLFAVAMLYPIAMIVVAQTRSSASSSRRKLASPDRPNREQQNTLFLQKQDGVDGWVVLLPSLLAALNPFQIYYSQEARMYILLMLATLIFFYALLGFMQAEAQQISLWAEPWPTSQKRQLYLSALVFVLSGAIGLWTHYSFPILLAAAGIAYLFHWHLLKAGNFTSRMAPLGRFALLSLLIVLLYLPWIRTAVERVLAWPKGGGNVDWRAGLEKAIHLLLFGPLRNLGTSHWLLLLAAVLLLAMGWLALYQGRRRSSYMQFPVDFVLLVWFLAPLAMMFGLGLFDEAFLKFLLVASPTWSLLVGSAPLLFSSHKWLLTVLMSFCIVASFSVAIWALPGYYSDDSARDNYAGIARYIESQHAEAQLTNGPTLGSRFVDNRAIVILNAPGQQDVWRYYDPGIPVLALPQERPANRPHTEDLLKEATEHVNQVYGIFWATDESDPDGIVERWLDHYGFKGLGQWQGNIRFVHYSFAADLRCQKAPSPSLFSDSAQSIEIQLLEQCQPSFPQEIPSGNVSLLGLQWQPLTPVTRRFKVTVQLLDSRNQVIAQRDSEPGGGSLPTIDWQPNQLVQDNHGLMLPFGTPPGSYSLIVALYDGETNQRLSVADGDFLRLGEMNVIRNPSPPPVELLPILYRVDRSIGPVTLLGYDLHRKGFAHAPNTAIEPGHLVHLTLYWQAPHIRTSSWDDDLHVTLTLGNQSTTVPLAGGIFPTSQWEPGDLIRGEFDILFDGSAKTLRISVQDEQVVVSPSQIMR